MSTPTNSAMVKYRTLIYILLLINSIVDSSVVSVPGANYRECFFPPTNSQFDYDRADVCDHIVTEDQETGSVSGISQYNYF